MRLKDFFSKWFYISFIMILFGILISLLNPSDPLISFLLKISSNLTEDIGIAILIANIFSFTIGTEQFLDYIRDRLVKIVVSKEFINKLSPQEQRNMLQLVLKPSKQLSDLYSGIKEYFNQYIEESMNLFTKSYRGHMKIDGVASFNEEAGKVQVEYDVDYIIYKVSDQFEPLIIKFEEECYKHVRTVITGKGGDSEEISIDSINTSKASDDPSMASAYEIPIPEKFNSLEQISISMSLVEFGSDHWHAFSFKTLKPCDQLSIVIRCDGDLIIKDANTYGVQKNFSIEKSDKKIKVTYSDWLSPGFGANIMIAREDHHKPNKITQSLKTYVEVPDVLTQPL